MARLHTDLTIPTDQEALLARQLKEVLERHPDATDSMRVEVTGTGKATTTLQLPRVAAVLLVRILDEMSKGNAVSLVPTETEITTQQAADLLNVSRPYLIGMIERSELPVRMVGNQRRLPLADVLAYKAKNQAKRIQALAEMTAIDQESGLR